MTTVDPPDLPLWQTARRLVPLWWEQRRLVSLGLVCALAFTALTLMIPILVQRTIDDAIDGPDRSLLVPYLAAIVVIGESHLLASTYEELGILAINIQTCSESMDLVAGLESACASLGASAVRALVVMRRLDAPMRVVLQAVNVPVREGRLRLDAAVAAR